MVERVETTAGQSARGLDTLTRNDLNTVVRALVSRSSTDGI